KKGNNLVYRDDFVSDTFRYMVATNQVDTDDKRLVSNTEANGRFHSDWLSMMYHRLRVVKNILSTKGVVVISIDDAETANVIHLCNEIFGEGNFVGTIIWKNATDNNPTNIAIEHETIHVFAKDKTALEGVWKSSVSDIKDVLKRIGDTLIAKFDDQEALQTAYTLWFRENKVQLGPLDRYKYIDKDGVYTGSQSVHNPGKEGYRYDVIHPENGRPCKEPLMGYRFPKETMDRLLSEERILFGEDENKIIELKVYAQEFEDKLSSVFELDGRTGPYDLKSLFPEGKKVFSNPKPVTLVERLVSFSTGDGDICVDLFAGSSTLAHAVIQLAGREGKTRKFISVQYPEEIEQDNKDAKEVLQFCQQVGLPPLISAISKERIRRAGKKILEGECHPDWNKDIGFRVLKVDSSNMADVYYAPDQTAQADLLGRVSNIKPDRDNPEDLLFQVMLDWAVDLTLPIRRETLHGKTVFFVNHKPYDLIACFDDGVTEELIKELAGHQPLRMVFKDTGFASDAVKINAIQIFRQLSAQTDVKSI
ncbi:MAG: site-specific DNA-methyltransferase, partial [Pseudomonadota bacterium]